MRSPLKETIPAVGTERYELWRMRLNEYAKKVAADKERAREAERVVMELPLVFEETPLPEYLRPDTPITTSMWLLLKSICLKHDVSPGEVIGSARDKRITQARKEYMIRCFVELQKTPSHVGMSINKDRTTVLSAWRLWKVKGDDYFAPVKEEPTCSNS